MRARPSLKEYEPAYVDCYGAFSNHRVVTGCFGFGGEGEVEGGAFAGFTFGPDFAAVALDNVFDDGETEAGAALFTRAGFVHAIEAFEDAFQGFRWDAGAVVLHAEFDGITVERAAG